MLVVFFLRTLDSVLAESRKLANLIAIQTPNFRLSLSGIKKKKKGQSVDITKHKP